MSRYAFTISEDEQSIGDSVEAEVLHALRTALPQGENTSFVLSARDAAGILAGGLTANTSYGWLHVKTLWVAEGHRQQSLGRALMDRAEEKARKSGCHAAWLDTSSPDARRFYARLGYATFGKLANAAGQHPATHRRWFMQKVLCGGLTSS